MGGLGGFCLGLVSCNFEVEAIELALQTGVCEFSPSTPESSLQTV